MRGERGCIRQTPLLQDESRESQLGRFPFSPLALAQKPSPPHAVDPVWSPLHSGSDTAVPAVRSFAPRAVGAQFLIVYSWN